MEVAAWPRQLYPANALEPACPRASLGPSRPSFIDEVHADRTACALSQVRTQNSSHLWSEPAPHGVILRRFPRRRTERDASTNVASGQSAQGGRFERGQLARLGVWSRESGQQTERSGLALRQTNCRSSPTGCPTKASSRWLWRAHPSTGSPSTSCSSRGASRSYSSTRASFTMSQAGRLTSATAQWLQLLHSCGLLRGSFRPGEAITRLRALQRQLGNLVAVRTRCVQWMQKALDEMNVQMHRAVTDLTGATGMAIVRAIVAGERDGARLARHRERRCRKSATESARYLTGTWRDEHLFNLASARRLLDALEAEITAYDAELLKAIEGLLPPETARGPVPPHRNPAKEKATKARGEQPARTILWRFAGVDLTHVGGNSAGAAQVVLTEARCVPLEDRFVSWLRLCPRTPISGGKPLKKRRSGLGANRIAGVFRMAATSLQRSQTDLGPPSTESRTTRVAQSPSSQPPANSPGWSTACSATDRPARQSAGTVRRRKIPDPRARSDATGVADAPRAKRAAHARLHAAWHHHALRGLGCQER